MGKHHFYLKKACFYIQKITSTIVFTIICLILTQAATPVLAGENLVVNPGFESGTTGWYGSGCSFAVSDTVYRSGSQSGYAYDRTDTWNSISQSMLNKMQPGKTYHISGWMKIEGVSSSGINVTVGKTDDSGTTYTWVGWTTGYDDSWTYLSGSYTLNVTGTLTNLFLYFEGPPADVNYYLDDVNVTELGDQWKQDANDRIEQCRKRDARITVVNPSGYPVRDVNVQINQIKHRFAFGSCINGNVLSDANYANFFKNHYEWAVMENESKWYSNETTQGNVTYTTADNIYDWCAANGITVRGHCIYWEVEGAVQDWIKSLAYAPLPATSALRTAVESRMDSAVNHFKDKFVHWDVDNEMLHGSFYKDRLGEDIHPWMFQAAHAIDPNCKLFVNDYSVVSGGETEAYKAQIQDLLYNNAPVQGIGVQCHFSGSAIDPYTVYARIDSLAQMELPIWCTEFDFQQPDVNLRADGLEALYRTAFSHPSVEGILGWGFWENSFWKEDCFIVDANWVLNEAGNRYESLISEWTTNDANTTNLAGDVNFRGFNGVYEITLTVAGAAPEVKTIELEPGQTPAEFILTMDNLVEPADCNQVQAFGYALPSDLNGDCKVTFVDFAVLAGHWLDDTCVGPGNCDGADFEPPDGIVDIYDMSDFADQWLLCNDPLNPNCIQNW
ncbi:MAG: endo-1,4-beta-xylanase [Sedimentisphaerales bacterium]|nr:endo-1,4-beta-xylanase [Sedimentisphaerales bacterium]